VAFADPGLREESDSRYSGRGGVFVCTAASRQEVPARSAPMTRAAGRAAWRVTWVRFEDVNMRWDSMGAGGAGRFGCGAGLTSRPGLGSRRRRL